MNQPIINIHTGQLSLGDTLSVYPQMDISQIRLDSDFEHRQIDKHYRWIYVRDLALGDRWYYISLCFRDNLLDLINLSFEIDNYQQGWDNWSYQHELNKLKIYQQWISQQTHNQEQFKWGSITANYDPRSASSAITVRYTKSTDK